jgi:hypothetical protein
MFLETESVIPRVDATVLETQVDSSIGLVARGSRTDGKTAVVLVEGDEVHRH